MDDVKLYYADYVTFTLCVICQTMASC